MTSSADVASRSGATHDRPRVALLVNMVPPYRVPVYRALAEAFRLTLHREQTEDNRRGWDGYAEQVGAAEVHLARGLTVRRNLRRPGSAGVFENHYLHLTPGHLGALWRAAPDAVITNEMGIRTLVALFYGTLCRRPVWVCWEGTPHTQRLNGRLRRTVHAVVARWAHHWISFGNEPSAYLESLGVPRGRIVQVQNCVDDETFRRPVAPAFVLAPSPVVLHVGRLVGLKGVPHLLDAAAVLQREGRRFSLLLVGDGPEREALAAHVDALGLRDVHFVPDVSADVMPAIYRSADVLVMPTLHDVWGLVVNEALWAGVPVLASKYAGCATELLPSENVFDPADIPQLVGLLRRALDGTLAPADPTRMLTPRDVAGRVIADVCRVLGGRVATSQVVRTAEA